MPRHRPPVRSVLFALAALPLVSAARPHGAVQAPASYHLTHVGRDSVPFTLRGPEGQALLTIEREVLVLGPGDRAERVATMRAAAYERIPCDLLRQVRARARGDTAAAAAVRPDTTPAECAALRTVTDTARGTLAGGDGARTITWASDGARVRVEQRGDTVRLHPERSADPDFVLRYLRRR